MTNEIISGIVGYLDPGTGSFILQMLIAFFLGSIFAIKIFWSKIRGFFERLFGIKPKDEEEISDSEISGDSEESDKVDEQNEVTSDEQKPEESTEVKEEAETMDMGKEKE